MSSPPQQPSQRQQAIVDTVAGQLNDKYTAFAAERPGWSGGVSLLCHSLGSVKIVRSVHDGWLRFKNVRMNALSPHAVARRRR